MRDSSARRVENDNKSRVDLTQTSEHDDLRAGVREVCERFDGAYWRKLEPDSYPEEFVNALPRPAGSRP